MLTNRLREAKKVKLGVQVTQLLSFWPSKQWLDLSSAFLASVHTRSLPSRVTGAFPALTQSWPLRHLSRTLAWHSFWYFLLWSGMDLISAVEIH